jgi:hypothetical protein
LSDAATTNNQVGTERSRAEGDVARQIVPQHFVLNTCYGAATLRRRLTARHP